MIKERGNKLHGYHRSEDIWVKKLLCSCGNRFNRKTWHHKNGEPQYAYMCYKQARQGSVETRRRKGLSLEDACTSEMIPRWKLDALAKGVLGLLFNDRKAIVKIAEDLLERNIMEELERDDEAQIQEIRNAIKRSNQKIDNLLELRLADEISKELFASKKESVEKEIQKFEEEIKEIESKKKLTTEEIEERLQILKYALENNFSFDVYSIPDTIIDALIDKVVVHEGYYEWYIKLLGDQPINCLVGGTKKHPEPSVLVKDEKKLFSEVTLCRRR